jgi:tetratricopeptide (TPR) repeat protein
VEEITGPDFTRLDSSRSRPALPEIIPVSSAQKNITMRFFDKHKPAYLTKKTLLVGGFSVALIIATITIISLLWRAPAARFFWNVFHLEAIPLALDPSDADLAFQMGVIHFGGGGRYDIQKAQHYFLRTIEVKPDFAEAHYQLGRTYFIESKFYSALYEMKEAMRSDPDFKRPYYMYGLISGYQGNLDQAAWGFQEFIKRDDFNWAGYNDLAWVYFKKGDYQKTADTAAKGLENAYHNPWLSLTYGTALLNLGRKEQALASLEIALEESEKLTPESWGIAYPGNDPKIYAQGLEEMRQTIRRNIELAKNLP